MSTDIVKIKFKRSKVAGKIPTDAQLDEGEIALNLVDRRIFTKNGNNIIELGFAKGGTVDGEITATRFIGPLTGNATTASKLANRRSIRMDGDATWSVNFDGSSNASGTLTLSPSGVTAGSYNAVTVDSKGRVTKGLTQTISLVTATSATGTSNVATNNSNTYLNIVNTGAGTSAAGSSTKVTGKNGITVSSDTNGVLTVSQTLTNNLTSTSTTQALTANQGKILNDTKANIVSPTFTGMPKAPTPSSDSNDTTLATTAFVKSTQPQISVLTGTITHGGTLPLPSGYSESQCRFMVSVNKDNPNKSAWDINENGWNFHYGFECWVDGRVVHVGAYLGHYGSRTNFVAGVANYIVIGVR